MRIIEKFTHIKESNKIELVIREPSNSMLLSMPPKPAPDKIYKEIYGVENGVITKIQTIQGVHTPSYVVNDTYEF